MLLGAAEILKRLKADTDLGSEDFSYVSEQTPTVCVILAAGDANEGYAFPLHYPKVAFDEKALSVGAAVYVQGALTVCAG